MKSEACDSGGAFSQSGVDSVLAFDRMLERETS